MDKNQRGEAEEPVRQPHYAHVMLVGDHEEQPKPGLDTGQQQNDQQTGYDERRGDILQRIRRRLITIEYSYFWVQRTVHFAEARQEEELELRERESSPAERSRLSKTKV